jgi:hypothetical protein
MTLAEQLTAARATLAATGTIALDAGAMLDALLRARRPVAEELAAYGSAVDGVAALAAFDTAIDVAEDGDQ